MARRESYLEQAYAYQRELWHKAAQARFSRRLVIRAGALAALGGASAISALLQACAGAGAERTQVGLGETGTYRYSRYPLVEKYHWRKLPWSDTPYIGGTLIGGLGGAQPTGKILDGADIPYAAFFGNRVTAINVFGPNNPVLRPEANFDRSDIVPDLAESIAHSPDFTQWTVRIHRGVLFHDLPPVNGRECTADDVAYCFQRFIDTGIHGAGLGMVDRIEPVDRYTVRFTLKYPYLPFEYALSLPPYIIFPPEYFETAREQMDQQPILTGPFIMTYNRVRDRTDAVRNPRFFRKDLAGRPLPYLDKFTKPFFADAAAQLSAFRTGQTDVYLPGDLDVLENVLSTNPNALVEVIPYWSTHPTHWIFQHKNPLFQDVRVRRALNMAIDRKRIIETLYRGAAVISRPMPYDFVGLEEPQRDEELGPYFQYNPSEAKRLLTEAGYADGLTVEWMVSGQPSDQQLLIEENWKQIGVHIKWDQQEGTVLSTHRNRKTFNGIISMGNNGAYELDTWAQRAWGRGSVLNWGSYEDPVLLDLIERQHRSTDPDERLRIARQMQERLFDQIPHLYGVTANVIEVWQPWLHGAVNGVNVKWDNRGEWAHMGIWVDDTAPAGRGGRRAT